MDPSGPISKTRLQIPALLESCQGTEKRNPEPPLRSQAARDTLLTLYPAFQAAPQICPHTMPRSSTLCASRRRSSPHRFATPPRHALVAPAAAASSSSAEGTVAASFAVVGSGAAVVASAGSEHYSENSDAEEMLS